MWRVTVTADVDTEDEANRLLSDLEEAVGKHDGDLLWNEAEDLEGEAEGGGR